MMLIGVDAACAEPDVLGYANVRCICMWRVVVLRVRVCVCVLGVHSFPYVCARAHVCANALAIAHRFVLLFACPRQAVSFDEGRAACRAESRCTSVTWSPDRAQASLCGGSRRRHEKIHALVAMRLVRRPGVRFHAERPRCQPCCGSVRACWCVCVCLRACCDVCVCVCVHAREESSVTYSQLLGSLCSRITKRCAMVPNFSRPRSAPCVLVNQNARFHACNVCSFVLSARRL